MKFLPKQKTFKSTVANTERYTRLKGTMTSTETEAYLSVMTFASQEFESFLRQFQFEQPMIHLLYPAMVELIRTIMTKFIRRKYLQTDEGTPRSAEEILKIDVLDAKKCKSSGSIDIGTKAKVLLNNDTLFPSSNCQRFRAECLRYYQIATKYLLDNLPLNKKLIQYAQFLHHEKRNSPKAMNAFSNLGMAFTKVLGPNT